MADFAVAVTGGIASGKTAVTRHFELLGPTVVDADAIARSIVEPGQAALAEIIACFGAGMLAADGRLNRRALRERIFSDSAARRELEAIMHPRIRDRIRSDCDQAPGSYVIAAIPLLTEGGGRAAYPWLDRILVVDVPERLQLDRLRQRDGVPTPLAQSMLDAQASRQARLAMADDVLTNDGPLPALAELAAKLDARYRKFAASTGG